MPLPAESVYNELNGEETLKILHARCLDILQQIPEFKRHISLSRVKMQLDVRFEIEGRTPPAFRLHDDYTVKGSLAGGAPQDIAIEIEAGVSISTDPEDPAYEHPDTVRQEHGLPTMVPTRSPSGLGTEDVAVLKPDLQKYGVLAPSNVDGYAAFKVIDKGSAVRGHRVEEDTPGVKTPTRDSSPAPVKDDFKSTRGIR